MSFGDSGAMFEDLAFRLGGTEVALAWLKAGDEDPMVTDLFPQNSANRIAAIFDYGYLRGVGDCHGLSAFDVAKSVLEEN